MTKKKQIFYFSVNNAKKLCTNNKMTKDIQVVSKVH